MASEQFSLCWDNFHKNMSMGMQSLLETEDLVDVTLAVEGKYLKAHKMVLSVCSPYFRELFQTNPCKHPIVFMKDVSYIALSDLLHFMYQGEVQVAQENLPTFIKTAEALQVKGLTGDSGAQNDSESELEVEKLPTETTAKRVHDTSDPKPTTAARSKRFSGPASKRPKFSNVSTTPSTTAPVSAVTTTTGSKYEVASVNTNHSQSSDDVNLKMEPNESTEHLQTDAADDSQLEQYADDSAGFEMTDETEDFSLIESSNDDPKPGTSTEVGDNQDYLVYSITKRGKKCLLYNNYIYYLNQFRDGRVFWVCSDYYKVKCRSRIVTDDKDHVRRLHRMHNHPPNMDRIREHFNTTH